MKRWLFFSYGVACHLLFLAVFAYMAGFVGGFYVPKTIDTPSELPIPVAGSINFLLLGLFAVQHSVMARPAFKRQWTRLVPQPIERSTYVLASCIVTIVLMAFWQGIDIKVWDAQNTTMRAIVWALFAVGWLLVPTVSLMINHFDLFGTRQVWFYLQGLPYKPLEFHVPHLYKYVRHPLYVGWALAFWAIPTMTTGHLLFAAVMTIYMAGAALVEERDLIAYFGDQYRDYRRRVPMFVPRVCKLSSNEPAIDLSHSNIQGSTHAPNY